MENFLGFVRQFLGQRDMAVNIIESTRSSNPERYHVGMALLAQHEGDNAQFRSHMEKAAEVDADDPHIQALLAEARTASPGDSPAPVAGPEGDALLTRAATGAPGRLPIDDTLDDLESCALDQLQAKIDGLKDGDKVLWHLAQAVAAARSGDMDGYSDCVAEAAELDPEHLRVKTFSVADNATLSPDMAEKLARAALENDDSGRAWEALGASLYLGGHWAKAQKAFEVATFRDLDSTFSLIAQAAAMARLEKNAEAVQLLGEVFDESPNDPRPLLEVRDLFGLTGWSDGAVRFAEMTLEGAGIEGGARTLLELFTLAVAHSQRERIIDPDLRDQSGLLAGLKLRAAASSGALKVHLDAVLSAIEADDSIDALVWTTDDSAEITKLRGVLGTDEAAPLVASWKENAPFEHALGEALIHIEQGAFPLGLKALGNAFELNPASGSITVALMGMYAPVGASAGGLVTGTFVSAMPDAPGVLIARAMLDGAVKCVNDVPPLRGYATEYAQAFLEDLFEHMADYSEETKRQILSRAMVFGEDVIKAANAESNADIALDGVTAQAPPALPTDRIATLLGYLRPHFALAERTKLIAAESDYLKRLGRYDLAHKLSPATDDSTIVVMGGPPAG